MVLNHFQLSGQVAIVTGCKDEVLKRLGWVH